MATPINTLKNWFKTGLKPTQSQFWAWIDSFRHKDELVPAADISGLQQLLDAKVDKKDIIQNKGVFDPAKAYVFDALLAEYVSFTNEASPDEFYRVERWFRLLANTTAGESPETAPAKWKHIGTVLGEIAIEDVVGLREELDALNEGGGTGGGHTILNTTGEALPQQPALQFKGVPVTDEAGKTIVDMSGKADKSSLIREERISLIGHTSIPTAFWQAENITAIPVKTNINTLKLVNTATLAETPLITTGGALVTLPVAVPAANYNYVLTYAAGTESGVLIIQSVKQ